MPYQGRQPGVGVRNRFLYTATASQTTFSGADDNGRTLAYQDGAYVDVYLNGVMLVPGTDFTATTKTSITLTSGAAASDIVEIIAYDISSIADTVSKSQGGTFDGSITVNGSLSVDGGTIKLDGNYPVGTNNVALGDGALDAALTGSSNTAVGSFSLTNNTSGGSNTGLGFAALGDTTTGSFNTAVGTSALENSTTASNNTAVGYQSLFTNTAGEQNVAIGLKALYSNTTSNNTAVGYEALELNTTGTANVAVGLQALENNTTGGSNVALGFRALEANTTASNNTAMGYEAFKVSTTAADSVAVGYRAGVGTTEGGSNTFLGRSAGESNTTGSYNTFVGISSGEAITTGSKNTIIGKYTGNQGGLDIRTSSNNIVLSDGDGNPRLNFGTQGTGASGWRLFGASHTNTNAIGCGEALQILSENDGSNFFGILINFDQSIHGGNVNNLRFFNRATGIVGSITSGATSTAYNTSSDYRLKEDLQPMVNSVDRLMALKPVNFAWKTNGDRVDGFLAHEVQDIVPEAIVGTKDEVDADGNPVYQGIDQSKLVPLLTAALQEALTEIASLKARLDAANL
jgi:hypothetical protein